MITRDFSPPDDLLRLSNQALKDLMDNGYAFVTLPNGNVIRITEDDLLFKVEEIEAYKKSLKDLDKK